MPARKFLIFQHLDIEHPGVFLECFREANIAYDTVELDQGDAIPPLKNYDALWVMGGPMDVWQEEQHPWLVDEKHIIRKAVQELQMPYMGICLGHQLLVAALGGEVGPGQAEVGIMDVEFTEAGQRSPFLAGLPNPLASLQWHGAEVKTLVDGMTVLASSSRCQYQSLSYGNKALTSQFHVEITPQTVPEWNRIQAYQQALQAALGDDGATALEQAVMQDIESFNTHAKQLFTNWMACVF